MPRAALRNPARRSASHVVGRIHVASEFTVGLHDLPPVLETFRESYPEVEIVVQYLYSPEVCVAVADESRSRPRRLSADLADRRPIELSALATENYIAFSPDAPTVRHLERSLRKHQADLTPAVQSDNVETVKRAVEVKGGFSLKDIRLERPLAIAFKPTRTRGTVVRAY